MSLGAYLMRVPPAFRDRAYEHIARGEGEDWFRQLDAALPNLAFEDPTALDLHRLRQTRETVTEAMDDAIWFNYTAPAEKNRQAFALGLHTDYRLLTSALSDEVRAQWADDERRFENEGDDNPLVWSRAYADPLAWAAVGAEWVPLYDPRGWGDMLVRYTPPERVREAVAALNGLDLSAWAGRHGVINTKPGSYSPGSPELLARAAVSIREFLRLAAEAGQPAVHVVDYSH